MRRLEELDGVDRETAMELGSYLYSCEKETLKEGIGLLRKSIKKWSHIVHLEGLERGRRDCSLCNKYYQCTLCPIDVITGKGCFGTPYEKWANHHWWDHFGESEVEIGTMNCKCSECKRIALDELMFLQNMLEFYKYVLKNSSEKVTANKIKKN